ncbi:MAG TPA: Ig-like domain-containing protein, partial [Gemmatimonadaceae bacterium]
FTSPNLTSVTSSTVALSAGAAAALSITTQPSTSVLSGVLFGTQPAIQLRDVSNNAVSQAGVTITAAVQTGTGILGGTLTAATNSSGLATFTNLSILGTGAHTLRFTSPNLTQIVSGSIGIAAQASQLSIATQPSASAQSGVAFSTQPAIQLRDASGNAVGSSGVVVTATIASGGGTLGGVATATTNSSGLATFSSLSISGADGPRTLQFTSPSLTSITSATVNVAAVTSTDGCVNEPAGYTRFHDQPWDAAPAFPTQSLGWSDPNRDAAQSLSITNDATAPFPGNHNVLQAKFKQGSPGGSGPFYIERNFATNEQYHNLYMCIYLKHSANFDNTNGNAGTKFMWPIGDPDRMSATYLSFHASIMDFMLIQQGAVDRMLDANVVGNTRQAQVVTKNGSWIRYEVLIKGNSSDDTPDGELHIWIDGVKTHQFTNVQYLMSSARKWTRLIYNPTYGGGTNPVPYDQYQYIDHIRLSGSP